jgi:hypothetical protein
MAKVNIEDIKGNSFKSKELATETKPLNTQATVKMKEKSVSRKFKEAIFSNETGDVKSYLVFGIIIPAIKSTIVNVGTSALELIFGVGSSNSYYGVPKKKNTPYYQYYSSEVEATKSSGKLTNSYSRYAYKELNCNNFAIATEIRDRMLEAISKYHRASVGDLYDTVQEVCEDPKIITAETTDYKWGWKTLEHSYIKRELDGSYTLILPDPVYLD